MMPVTPEVNSNAFAGKLAIALSLLSGGVYLVSLDSALAVTLGVMLIGTMFSHAVELQHQCLHNTAFKSRVANRVVGILLGIPMLSSFHAYRRSHMEHHRLLGTPSDKPYFTYKFLETPSIAAFLHDVFGIAHLKSSVNSVLRQGKSGLITVGSQADEDYTAERVDYALMAFALACAYLYSITTGSEFVLKAWLFPMLLVGQPLHFLVELPEHIGCDAGSTDPFKNTRSIGGSWFSRWFTNGNNYHVEHHLLPALSMDQLYDAYLRHHGHHHHFNRSYLDFYTSIFRLVRSHAADKKIEQSARTPA